MQLVEVILVELAVPPEAGDAAERVAAVDAELARLLQQPFVGEHAVQAALLVDVELEVGALHRPSSFSASRASRARSRRR